MGEFVYNEDTRVHTLSGKIIPSVSQVIAPLSNFDAIPQAVLARKAELGTQFHEAIRLHLLNDLAFDSIDPDLVKPMETFIEWWTGLRKVIAIEKPIHHKRLKYCGCPDLYAEGALYDWKLRDYIPVVDTLKLTAYNHMITRKELALWTICFDLKGGLKIRSSNHPKAWGIFRKMLERYYSEREFYNLMEQWKGVN